MEREPNPAKKSRGKLQTIRTYAFRGMIAGALGASGGAFYAHEHPDQASRLSRQIVGDEWTVKLEGYALYLEDQARQLKFEVFGGDTNPFAENIIPAAQPDHNQRQYTDDPSLFAQDPIKAPEPPRPIPLRLPETYTLLANPNPGEGVWSIDNLPRTSSEDVLMAKTYIRPDEARPYASVGVLLLDKRRIRLNFVAGTDNGGPGIIPESEKPNLLAAFNGGFQLQHASWGMYANGKEYKALRKDYASIVIMNDGAIKMGTWGYGDLTARTEDMTAVRQNGLLLVNDCEINSRTNTANPDDWGRVNAGDTASFITSRSAVGLTSNGDLLVATGTNLSAATLAKALRAAGACFAMQLDINSPYVLTSLYYVLENGTIMSEKFMQTMNPDARKFFTRQARDFFYITHDETNYKP